MDHRRRPGVVRRPWQVATAAGAAAHHGFELGCGVGLLAQRELGLPAAVAAWLVALPGFAVAAARAPERADAGLAFVTGANLAAALAHYTIWPWRLRGGVPLLEEAEGLPARRLPAYNALLLAWQAVGWLAAAREVHPGHRVWVLLGLASAMPLRRHAQRHAAWLDRQARLHPAWWNRARRER